MVLNIIKKLPLLFLFLFLIHLVSAIPTELNLQGKLRDIAYTELEGTYTMVFRLYTAYTGGIHFYTDTQTVSVSHGLYDVMLKDINTNFPLDTYYLGVTIGADAEATPRMNITSVPFAFRTNQTDYLVGNITGNTYVAGNIYPMETLTYDWGSGPLRWRNIYASNYSGDYIEITNDLISLGNITAGNVFLPAYIFAHTSINLTLGVAGAAYNLTFNEEESSPKLDIQHTHTDATNDTFTIGSDGIYDISWHIAFVDKAANPTGHIVTRIIKNGVEIPGSVMEKDTTKQNDHITIDHNIIVSLSADDEIKVQIITDVTTISTETLGTYGVHKDSTTVDIHRIA